MAHRLDPYLLRATLLVAALAGACKGDSAGDGAKAEPTPTAPASAASPTEASPAPKVAAVPEVAGVPAAADLSGLEPLAGPTAEGNVAEDLAAADKAASCKIVEGKLADCNAAEDAFRSSRNNFVIAKAPAHVRTVFNLLAHESPSVRMLVLDADPIHYADVYGDDIADKAPLHSGLLAAAAAETDPGVRGTFAWAITDVPDESVPGLTGILGAIAEQYRADEEGEHIVGNVADRCGEDLAPCRDALLGVAARNPDPRMQLAALEKVEYLEPAAATYCPLVRRTLDALTDDDDASTAVHLLTSESVDCGSQLDPWLETFPARAKAGKLVYPWLDAALSLADREDAKTRIPKLRALGKQLQGIIGEDDDLRGMVDDLATLQDA